mmetsp:Transcript_15741/g.32241  ORF Transcript_15741/g.32241 Transcript_15741/m.32241 type:complete len:137 (-) Transcript_15741:333-743(-)
MHQGLRGKHPPAAPQNLDGEGVDDGPRRDVVVPAQIDGHQVGRVLAEVVDGPVRQAAAVLDAQAPQLQARALQQQQQGVVLECLEAGQIECLHVLQHPRGQQVVGRFAEHLAVVEAEGSLGFGNGGQDCGPAVCFG